MSPTAQTIAQAPPSGVGPLPRVGELLLGAGFVSDSALAGGLARQRQEDRKLGELIVESGMCDQADLELALAIQEDLRAGRADEIAAVAGSRLGAILLASKSVTREQLDRALAEIGASEQPLGAVLVRQGALSAAQLDGALAFQKHAHARISERFKLGRILVEAGDISEQALRRAIKRHLATGKRLGEALIESGAISQSALAAGLARQRRLIAAAMAALAIVMGGGMPADATAATTTLQISATVLPLVAIRSMKVPPMLVITAADVARGYIDLDQAVEMEVKTNSGAILFGLSLNSPSFSAAVVTGPAGTTRITSSAPTLTIAKHAYGMRIESISMRVRIELAPTAVPETVAMPVSLLLYPA